MFFLLIQYTAFGHGAVKDPPSRNYIANPGKRKALGYDKCFHPEKLGYEYDEHGLGRSDIPVEISKRGRSDNNNLRVDEVGPPCGNGQLDSTLKYGEFTTRQFAPVKAYTPGSSIKLQFDISSQHTGHNWVDFACMDEHLDKLPAEESIQWTRLKIAGGCGTTVMWTQESGSEPAFNVDLPAEECKHGVLQWTWFGEQNWDSGNKEAPVECFYNCMDISITSDVSAFELVCPNGTAAVGKASGTGTSVVGQDVPCEDLAAGNAAGEGGNAAGEGGKPAGGNGTPEGGKPAGGNGSPDTPGSKNSDSTLTLVLATGIAVVVLIVGISIYCSKKNKKKKPPNKPPNSTPFQGYKPPVTTHAQRVRRSTRR